MKLWSLLGNSQKLDGGAMFGNAPKALWARWMAVDADNRIDLACRALLASPLSGKTVLFETGIGAFFPPPLRARYGVVEDRHVLLDSLEVTADAELSPRFGRNVGGPARFHNIRYTARIESPASEQEILALRDAVEETCPLYNLVKDEQTLEGSIVHGAYKGG